jgi:hypothetical protein
VECDYSISKAMATKIQSVIQIVRRYLVEPEPNFWSDDELVGIAATGVRDLWRDTVDLKQEHFLTTATNCSYPSGTLPNNPGCQTILGVPGDVHKIYMVEPLNITLNGTNQGLQFRPLPYNDAKFQLARSRGNIDPSNDTIWYAIQGAGGPVNAPVVICAPTVSSNVPLSFTYVPVLGVLRATDNIPIPGEADNAVIAWTVAYARAKEKEDRAPDPAWLTIYATEKAHLLGSLGIRQYQEATYSEATFEEYW